MRKRVGALIIENRRLLLVTNKDTDYYWSPGGTKEQGESDVQTLSRELAEELSLELKSADFYLHMEYPEDKVTSDFYIVEVDSQPQPASEVTDLLWYTKENFEDKKPKISSWLTGEVVPQLIRDKRL